MQCGRQCSECLLNRRERCSLHTGGRSVRLGQEDGDFPGFSSDRSCSVAAAELNLETCVSIAGERAWHDFDGVVCSLPDRLLSRSLLDMGDKPEQILYAWHVGTRAYINITRS